MASASCDPCEAAILEAKQHDTLLVEEFYDAVTDDHDHLLSPCPQGTVLAGGFGPKYGEMLFSLGPLAQGKGKGGSGHLIHLLFFTYI